MSKAIAYFISGLGADHRAYQFLTLDNIECRHIHWAKFAPNDNLKSYAEKLIAQIDQSKPVVLVGTSLGGMLAIEIAKMIEVKHTFIISSIKTKNEQPGYFSFFKLFPAYELVPNSMMASPDFWLKFLFPVGIKDEWKELFGDMFKQWTPEFIRWAMKAALLWDNKVLIENYTHIHGDQDIVFPHNNIKDYVLIPGGTHVMVLSRAREIKKVIQTQLQKMQEFSNI